MIDRDAAARLGITVSQIDNTLYDAFGQRQVSTLYVARNQYHVVMEVAPRYWQNPQTLKDVYISTSGASVGGSQATNAVAGTVAAAGQTASASSANANAARNLATNSIGATGNGAASTGAAVSTNQETMIPLSAVAHFDEGATPLAVNHQGLLVASTISFNLPPGVSLSTAISTIEATMNRIGVPATVRGTFQGSARAFQDSLGNQPYLILAALITIYLVLGVLYESYVHPLTILSTLPSAGVGALLALIACRTEFSIMSLIGVILLIGIVKKNAIMMIDFALDAQRTRALSPSDAIFEAGLLRFRPIMMTTMAATRRSSPSYRDGRWRRASTAARYCHRWRPHSQSDADALFDAGDLPVHEPVTGLGPARETRQYSGRSRAGQLGGDAWETPGNDSASCTGWKAGT